MKSLIGTAVLSLALLGCGQGDGKLAITGSSTMAPVMTEVAARFENDTGIEVNVQSGGSGRGINDVRQGLADIGMVSRALDDSESDLDPVVVARDGIAMIVNEDNPVDAITREDVRALYRGETDNWQALGWTDQPVTVINKSSGRATLTRFLEYFGLENRHVAADMVIGENQQGIQAVASAPAAIGYVSVGAAEYEAGAGTAIRLLKLDGVAASTKTVGAGRYPLGRDLNLITTGQRSAMVQRFLDYARSDQVKDLYRKHYFVPAHG